MPTPDPEPRSALSRRSVLRRAAGAGAAGFAVTALGTSAFEGSALSASAREASAREATTAARAAGTTSSTGPIIVHVRDAASGDIEVFAGTSQARLRDRDLATRIAKAIS